MTEKHDGGAELWGSLTSTDAAIIKTLVATGMYQHDVAAVFGCNSGRVSEIATGQKFAGVPPAVIDRPGPDRDHLMRRMLQHQNRVATRLYTILWPA